MALSKAIPTKILKKKHAKACKAFEAICGVSVASHATIKSFIRVLEHRIKAEEYLTSLFSKRAAKLKSDIYDQCRDYDRFHKTKGALGSYTALYMDRKRWVKKHGDLKGWNSYMNDIDIIDSKQLEQMERGLWRGAIMYVDELETLWTNVRDEEARHQNELVQETGQVA